MTCSWLLHNDENSLELSAICELEKQIWMEALSTAIKESKELYSNSVDSSEYLLEQLFVSSFDQYTQPKQNHDKPIEAAPTYNDTPVHYPIPNGSTSFSQSAIFNKPTKSNNRASHPVFSTQEFSVLGISNTSNGGTVSPGLRSQSSINDLREFFTNSVVSEKWTQRKFNQYHTRCKSVDTKFDDVCTTPILTARANSMSRNGSSKRRKAFSNANLHPSSVISLSKPSNGGGGDANLDATTISPVFYSPSTTFSESRPSGDSSRRPSISQNRPNGNTASMIFRLAQRNSSIRSITSNLGEIEQPIVPTAISIASTPSLSSSSSTAIAAGLLQSSSSLSNIPTARPVRFFDKMVEKLGQISTPGRRRHNLMSNNNNSCKSTLSSKPPTLLQKQQQPQNIDDDMIAATPSTIKKKVNITAYLFVYLSLIINSC
jgi:hypothetical protein